MKIEREIAAKELTEKIKNNIGKILIYFLLTTVGAISLFFFIKWYFALLIIIGYHYTTKYTMYFYLKNKIKRIKKEINN